MDLRSIQKPYKEKYRSDPGTAQITLKAQGSQTETPMACSVDIGRALYQAQAHSGIGGQEPRLVPGICSLEPWLPVRSLPARWSLHLWGFQQIVLRSKWRETWIFGVHWAYQRRRLVGFESIRVSFEIDAPDATAEQLDKLREKTEQYCVVMQTLAHPPVIQVNWYD